MSITLNGTTGIITPGVINSPAATALTLQSAGVTAITINTSQNVGIGGGTPSSNPKIALYGGIRFLSTETAAATYTGIGSVTLDNVSISTAGTERVRIDPSGSVSIGGVAPANKLDVYGDGVRSVARAASASGYSMVEAQVFNYWSGSTYTGTSLNQNGSTTTGTIAGLPNANLGTLSFQNGSAALIYTNNPTPIVFATTATERMRIDGNGNLMVRSTTVPNVGAGGTGFSVSSTEMVFSSNTNGGNAISYWRTQSGNSYAASYYNGNNNVGSIGVTTSSASYNTSSDYRLKDTIVPMTGALAKVALLKPCTYKWKIDGSDGQGFIAHELDEVVPGCVTGEKDAVDTDGNPQYQGIDTSFLVATLTAAIQEQQTLITDLIARVAALEPKV